LFIVVEVPLCFRKTFILGKAINVYTPAPLELILVLLVLNTEFRTNDVLYKQLKAVVKVLGSYVRIRTYIRTVNSVSFSVGRSLPSLVLG